MTLDDLLHLHSEAFIKCFAANDPHADANRASVLAVLQAVKRECVPEQLMSMPDWNDCIDEMNQRIDALMQDSPPPA